MAHREVGLRLTSNEVAAAFHDQVWSARYPPLLTAQQAAELLQVPLQTLYAWSSAGQLKTCGRRLGKHLRFFRDRLLLKLFNEGLDNND